MARRPGKQRGTDARRIGARGTGKLDRDARADRRTVRRRGAKPARPGPETPAREDPRARLMRERDDAIEQLRRLGISPETDENAPRVPDSVLDEGDQAQASERQDLAYATRERLAVRINRLTAALQRIEDGTYGQCAVCGQPIEPARLAALPEAETCLRCQEEREQAAAEQAA